MYICVFRAIDTLNHIHYHLTAHEAATKRSHHHALSLLQVSAALSHFKGELLQKGITISNYSDIKPLPEAG
jgi:hypothetical protein